MLNISIPSKPEKIVETDTYGEFEIPNLYPGYGHTLGNSIRRILIGSIQGHAITSVKIDGVAHEFSTIDGIVEDVLTIVLTLKNLVIEVNSEEQEHIIRLEKKAVGTVTAADIQTPTQVKIVNKDLHIAEITDKNTSLKIEMKVNMGIGYQNRDHFAKEIGSGVINLDASFSPIKKASYQVTNMRVGNRTDFNKLTMAIETNGTITPSEALRESIRVMILQLEAIVGFKTEENLSSLEQKIEKKVLNKLIDKIDLTSSVKTSLKQEGMNDLRDISRLTEKELGEIKGIGKKAIGEINKELAINGLVLKQ